MLHTADEIVIQGDPDRIYALAAAVEEWPAFLPHYRWVRVQAREGNRRTVEMAAWRPLGPSWTGTAASPGQRPLQGLPVRWISHQWLWPEERRITFRHIGGLSRGMEVEWRIVEAASGGGEGAVRVTITHALRLEVPVVRSRVGQWIVGEWFVRAVAGRTLACLKQRIEGEP